MSASSPVSVCNQALTGVGANTITSFADGSNEARLCNLHYAQTRDSVTTAYRWGFATRRFGPMTPEPDPPVYGFSHSYLLPPDLLELQFATTDSAGRMPFQIDRYEVEGGKLLCDVAAGLYIKYTARITDTTTFAQLYTEALIARLAAELAIPLAESKSLQAQYFKIYEAKVRDAAAVDNLQGRNRPTTMVNAKRARFAAGATPGFYSVGTTEQ